jgi:hypothetical protein
MGAINSSDRIAATLYSFRDMVCLRNIWVNTMHKGDSDDDDDDDDDNNNNNSNEKLKVKSGSYTRKTFDRFTTENSCTWNIAHNTESTAV